MCCSVVPGAVRFVVHVQSTTQHPGDVMCLKFSNAGDRLLSGCGKGVVNVWHHTTKWQAHALPLPAEWDEEIKSTWVGLLTHPFSARGTQHIIVPRTLCCGIDQPTITPQARRSSSRAGRVTIALSCLP